MTALPCLLLAAMALLHVAVGMKTDMQMIDMNGNPMGCELGGVTYNIYHPMPGDGECERCFCSPELRRECKDKRTMCSQTRRCVDFVYNPETCCDECPNGENCWLDERIVSACGVIPKAGPDENCWMHCECPSGYRFREDTQADCVTACA